MYLPDLDNKANRHLGRLLQLQAEHNGNTDFLIAGERHYSYADSNRIVNRYAHGLRGLGIGSGDRVLIYMNSCVDYVFLSLAVNKLGAVWVPTNTDYKGAWLSDSITDSKAKLIITDSQLLPRIREVESALSGEQILLRADKAETGTVLLSSFEQQDDSEPDMSAISYGDTAAILWTSGTTGKPKGVMQSHNAWIRSAESGNRSFETRAGDISYNCLPLYNSAAWVANIYRALQTGIPCAMDPHFSASEFWDRIRYYGATQTLTLGAMHMFLWKAEPRDDDADNPLRIAQMIPMPEDIMRPFCDRFGLETVNQGFGQSEIMALLVRRNSPDRQWKPNALGEVLPDIDVKLMDEDGKEVPPGTPGELCVKPKGPHIIFNGYFENPEATRNAYFGDWYRTGDLVMKDADGDYFYVDRKKDFIRYKGRNISSLQVEGVAMKHPAVSACAAFGITSEELEFEAEIKLDVVLQEGQQLTPEEIARFINDNAPYFMVPRYIEFVSELPYTPTNKVQKYKLREKGLTAQTWDRDQAGFEVKR